MGKFEIFCRRDNETEWHLVASGDKESYYGELIFLWPRAIQSEANGQQVPSDDAFIRHLERASAVVKTWPAWKQQILGGSKYDED